MVISRDDFAAWRGNDVTKAFFQSVVEKREDAKEILVRQAGIDSVEDGVLRGYYKALCDILQVSLDDVSEDTEDDNGN